MITSFAARAIKKTIVSVGIQARSTSTRLPDKMRQTIGDRTMLERVLDNVLKSATYLNNYNSIQVLADVTVLIPHGDLLKGLKTVVPMMEGDENDVLSRYVALQSERGSDFIVRITGDCPLIPPFVVSKMITLAVMNDYDYVSNVDERIRTAPDGFDCEVVSSRLLSYIDVSAKDPKDREHVTTFARKYPPHWAKLGCVINFLDLSTMKLSVDTKEDLESVRKIFTDREDLRRKAFNIFGRNHCHFY